MKLIYLIIVLLSLPVVVSTIEVQYSEDNITNWRNVTAIDETIPEALSAGLQSDTLYYFRAREDGGEWSYLQQRTKDEVNNMSLAAIIGIGLTAFLLLYFAFNLDEKHYILKLILIFFSLLSLTLIPNVLIMRGIIGSADSAFLKLILWVFRLFLIYVIVYLFYYWIQKTEVFVSWFGKKEQ